MVGMYVWTKTKNVVLYQVFVKSDHIQIVNKPLEKTFSLVMGLTSLLKREYLFIWLTFTLEISTEKKSENPLFSCPLKNQEDLLRFEKSGFLTTFCVP